MRADWFVLGGVAVFALVVAVERMRQPAPQAMPTSPTSLATGSPMPPTLVAPGSKSNAIPPQQVSSHPRPPTGVRQFNGYACTVDCSGHEAGYEWAERHGIEDPDDCGGNSESFIEGCRAYAEEQQSSTSSEDDEDEDEKP